MKGVIRLGDATTHGGKVISAAPNSTVLGIAFARQGDQCICPIKGHNNCKIAEGDPKVLKGGLKTPITFDDLLFSNLHVQRLYYRQHERRS